MATKVQLTGGAFQDVDGTPLASGYLLFQLSQDAQVNGNTQICAGYKVRIPLDVNGNIVTSPTYSIWPNDVLSPTGTFYTVSGYTAKGQLVWGPNAQQVFSAPSPYPVGDWVPGNVNTINPTVTTYDVGIYVPVQYYASQVFGILKFERNVQFAANLAPSTAVCGTNPTGSVVISIQKNGVQFATLTIATNGTCTYSGSATTFAVGDVLKVVGPASVDSTLAATGILLSGTVL